MALSSVISFNRGMMSNQELVRILTIMRSLELPRWNHLLEEPGVLHEALVDTLRHRGGEQRIPLPIGIGEHTFVNDLTEEELGSAVSGLKNLSHTHALDAAVQCAHAEGASLRP